MSDVYSAWNIDEKAFPAEGSAAAKLAFLTRYAMLAPSTYNTQPWLFEIAGDKMQVIIDRRYGLPVLDPEDRQMILNCSAALGLLDIAAKHFGLALDIVTPKRVGHDDVLAIVSVKGAAGKPVEQDNLFRAITKRSMNRHAFKPQPVSGEHVTLLQKAVSDEGAWLHICDEGERESLIRMIVEADHIQNANKNFRRELAAWRHPRRQAQGLGMAEKDYDFEHLMTSVSPVGSRRFYNKDGSVVQNDQINEGCPVLAVLGSVSGALDNKIKAGRGLIRLLLTAEANGLAVSTLNQPCQVPETRLRLYDELGLHGRAQIILRIGYPTKKADLAPRKPFSDVVFGQGIETVGRAQKPSVWSKMLSFVKRG